MRSRIIGSLIVKDKIVVQSFGFKKYLPIGSVNICLENLDNWKVDEIIIKCIDRSKKNLGPDLDLIDNVSRLGISTPLTYAGGIRNLNDAKKVIEKGADRICINNLFLINSLSIKNIAFALGSQSLLVSIDIIKKEDKFFWFDYVRSKLLPLELIPLDLLDYVSEIIITDVNNEGSNNKFDTDIVNKIKTKFRTRNLIFYGGINKKNKVNSIKYHFKNSSFAIGNFFFHKELANWYFK